MLHIEQTLTALATSDGTLIRKPNRQTSPLFYLKAEHNFALKTFTAFIIYTKDEAQKNSFTRKNASSVTFKLWNKYTSKPFESVDKFEYIGNKAKKQHYVHEIKNRVVSAQNTSVIQFSVSIPKDAQNHNPDICCVCVERHVRLTVFQNSVLRRIFRS
jgi:hypothetical protein